MIGADYDANEMVTLAQVCLNMFGWSRLAELLQKGILVHDYVAAHFMGIEYEEFLWRKKHGTKEQQKECKDWRQLTKAEDFGFPGGMGAAKFVEYARDSWGVKIEEETAKEHKKWWLELLPEIKLYQQAIGDQVAAGGGSFTVQQPVSGRVRGGVGYCDGCNTLFQGLAADMTKNALWWVTRECFDRGMWWPDPDREGEMVWVPGVPSPLYGSKPLFFMHDEIILEAPKEKAAKAAARLVTLMEASSRKYCPDVPGKASEWMTTHWYKKAETVRDDQGNLLEWTP